MAASYSMWDLTPQPGIKPKPPAVEVQSLNHWTTREVLKLKNLYEVFYCIFHCLLALHWLFPHLL